MYFSFVLLKFNGNLIQIYFTRNAYLKIKMMINFSCLTVLMYLMYSYFRVDYNIIIILCAKYYLYFEILSRYVVSQILVVFKFINQKLNFPYFINTHSESIILVNLK